LFANGSKTTRIAFRSFASNFALRARGSGWTGRSDLRDSGRQRKSD
jgi:hypothetical protein